jgi:uncharacterized protein with ParB-like and HNH nuclease domain
VPDFQREYVWEKSNVNQLLEDIYTELYENDELSENPEYFLGSIVIYRDNNGTFQLIDGQQRLTTIYLTFCVIRDYLKDLNETSKATEGLIAGIDQDSETGRDVNKYRLTLQYGDGYGLLNTIASDSKEIRNIDNQKSLSVKRIIDAYDNIKEFISEKFGDEPDKIHKFSQNFNSKVKLIKIETPNLKNALRVFETINARGVGLTSLDLLKNYLFTKISIDKSPKDYWEK